MRISVIFMAPSIVHMHASPSAVSRSPSSHYDIGLSWLGIPYTCARCRSPGGLVLVSRYRRLLSNANDPVYVVQYAIILRIFFFVPVQYHDYSQLRYTNFPYPCNHVSLMHPYLIHVRNASAVGETQPGYMRTESADSCKVLCYESPARAVWLGRFTRCRWHSTASTPVL